jgi:arginine/lysine/ornithine decarboxylase
MFSVHGSSGSNWIVVRTLALERRDALVLVARNIHHSVYQARRYAKAIGQEVPLRDAIGKVAAEEVEVYPPGSR